MTRRTAPSLLLPLAALLALPLASACGDGCGGCGGEDEPRPQPEASPVPADWTALTRGFAEHIPLGTHGLLVARGFAEFAEGFADIKERIRSIFDLAQVESEIRNTFGVDINRHVTFRSVGVAYDGGFAVATVLQQPVVGFYLTDSAPFFARAAEVLRRQPFNLRAPVQTERVGEAQIQLYARRLNEPVEFAVMADRGFGFLIPRASHATEVAEVARALAQTTRDTSLAAHPDFETQLARFPDYPGFGFIDTVAAASFYQERLGDQLSASSAHALERLSTTTTSLAGGARLETLELSFEAYLGVTPEVAAVAEGLQPTRTRDPGLAHFFLASTFVAVRLGAEPVKLWELLQLFQGEGGAQALDELRTEAEAFVGGTLQDDIAQALTGQVLVMVNRLAPLSLARAESLADYADAVDLLVAFEIGDRERLLTLLAGMVERSEGTYQRSAEDGGAVRFSTGHDRDSFGNLWVGDRLLLLGADRMNQVIRRLLATPIREGTGEGLGGLSEVARGLVTAPVATGAFVTFDRILPVATILNYPQAIRDLLGFLESLTVRLDQEGAGLHVAGRLSFTPASEQP